MSNIKHLGNTTKYQQYLEDRKSLSHIIKDLEKCKTNPTLFDCRLFSYYDRLKNMEKYDEHLARFEAEGDFEKRIICLYHPDGRSQLISISENATCVVIRMNIFRLFNFDPRIETEDEVITYSPQLFMSGCEDEVDLKKTINEVIPQCDDMSTVTPMFILIGVTHGPKPVIEPVIEYNYDNYNYDNYNYIDNTLTFKSIYRKQRYINYYNFITLEKLIRKLYSNNSNNSNNRKTIVRPNFRRHSYNFKLTSKKFQQYKFMKTNSQKRTLRH